MNTLRAIFVRASLHWGFMVRALGSSAAQVALPIAPPTTVVGALSAPLFKALKVAQGYKSTSLAKAGDRGKVITHSFDCARKATKAASMGLAPIDAGIASGIITYQELSRINASIYKGGGDWPKALKHPFGSLGFYSDFLVKAMPVQAVGVAYGPGAVIDLVWVFDVMELASCLGGAGALVSQIDSIGEVAAHGASCLGSKEGIMGVEEAYYISKVKVTPAYGRVIKTHVYVPSSCVKPLSRAAVSEIMLWDLDYNEYPVMLPAPATSGVIYPTTMPPEYEILEKCDAYVLSIGSMEVKVISKNSGEGGEKKKGGDAS